MQKTLRGPMRDCCSLSVTTRSAASTNFEHAAGAVGVSGAPFLIPRTCAPRLLFLTSRLRPTRRCQGARVPARVCGGGQRRLRSRRSSLCAPPGARSPPHDAPETVQNGAFIVYHPFAGGATTRSCASFVDEIRIRWRNFYLHAAPSSAARPGGARCCAARGLRLNGCGVTVSPRAAQ